MSTLWPAADIVVEYFTRIKNEGGDGLRTTREVATYFDTSLSTARRQLHKLHDAGRIGAFDNGNDHMGSPILWGCVGG